MDQEQIEKRIEWLESERREDKKVIADLQKRITGLEALIEKSNDYTKSPVSYTHLTLPTNREV